MKLTNIQADNILAIKSINMNLASAVTLICGDNGSMKSSIYDVVSLAVAGEPMRMVTLKKDYAQLVNDGAKAGGGLVVFNNDPDQAYDFNLPKGEFNPPKQPLFGDTDLIRVALNGQNFAKMDAKARLVFLRTLTKVRPSKEIVIPMLEQAGVGAECIEQVVPMLRSGFTAAEEFAKERALDSKRLWCSTTGKKAYGKDSAEEWEAPMPDAPKGDAELLKRGIEAQDGAINAANQALGAIKQAAAQAAADAEQRESLKALAGKVVSIGENLERSIKEGTAQLAKVEALRERARGTVRVGLVHDLAKFVNGLRASITDKTAALAQTELMQRYEAEHGAIGAAGAVDADAKAALPEQEKALTLYQNQAANLRRDLEKAQQAKGQYDALAAAQDAEDTTAELAEVNQLLEQAKAEKQRLTNELLDIEAATRNRAEAAKKNADAKKHHAEVTQWLLVAAELSPDGIPGRLLAAALEPVNRELEQCAADSGWPQVTIKPDMQIVIAPRADGVRTKDCDYALESVSYRWRADAHIAAMVAKLSGFKVMMLDGFDVLAPQHRGALFDWVDILVSEGDLDSVVLFGTLKAAPAADALPESFTSYWVEDGKVSEAAEADAAAA